MNPFRRSTIHFQSRFTRRAAPLPEGCVTPAVDTKLPNADVTQQQVHLDLPEQSANSFYLDRRSESLIARQRLVVPPEVREVFERKILPYLPPAGCPVPIAALGTMLPFWKAAKSELLQGDYGLLRVLGLFPRQVRLEHAEPAAGHVLHSRMLLVTRLPIEDSSSDQSNLVASSEEGHPERINGDDGNQVQLLTTSLAPLSQRQRQELCSAVDFFTNGATIRLLAKKLAWREWEHDHLFVVLHGLQKELSLFITYVPQEHIVVRNARHCSGNEVSQRELGAPAGIPRYLWPTPLTRDRCTASSPYSAIPLGEGEVYSSSLRFHSLDSFDTTVIDESSQIVEIEEEAKEADDGRLWKALGRKLSSQLRHRAARFRKRRRK